MNKTEIEQGFALLGLQAKTQESYTGPINFAGGLVRAMSSFDDTDETMQTTSNSADEEST